MFPPLVCLLLWVFCSVHAEIVDNSRPVTFIDLLSSDRRFSEFLHTVQRLRMVLPLNRIRNATMLVPTNDAIDRYRKKHGQDTTHVSGNVYQGVTDFQAWYHLIVDDAIDVEQLANQKYPMVWESLSYLDTNGIGSDGGIMLKTKMNGTSVVVVTTEEENDSYDVYDVRVLTKQMVSCVAGNIYPLDGVLNIPPTILEILHQAQFHLPSSSAMVSRSGFIDTTSPEDNPYNSLEQLFSAAEWSHVLKPAVEDTTSLLPLSLSDGMNTVWAFENKAFKDRFSFAEQRYLLHGPIYAKQAIWNEVDDNAEGNDIYQTALDDSRNYASQYISPGSVSLSRLGKGTHTILGYQNRTRLFLDIGGQDLGSSRVNGVQISRSDVVAQNGIVHGIGGAHPPEKLTLTPQKLLVGLNATSFVHLLRTTGLTSYIDGSRADEKLTLLVPTNRAMDEALDYDMDMASAATTTADGNNNNNNNNKDMDLGMLPMFLTPRDQRREWALYHILDGQYNIDELAQGTSLLRTKLASEKTSRKQQVVKVEVDRAAQGFIASSHVSFNGADNILSEPVVAGNVTIYLLSSAMDTPPNLINALIQRLDLSLFVAAMGASHTADDIQQTNGATVLCPITSSFTKLGLAWSYLSLPGDPDSYNDLSRLTKAHILTRPVYSDEIPMHNDSSVETLTVETLNGNKVGLYRTPHAIYAVPDQPNEELMSLLRTSSNNNGKYVDNILSSIEDTSKLLITESDILLRTGVAHVLGNGIILPSNVDITSSKLMRGMKAYIFASLLERFNLTYVLETPNKGLSEGNDNDKDDGIDVVGYSLLVPSDKAWRENPAYRELARRDQEYMYGDEYGDEENPWRNSTTADITSYVGSLVRLHIMPITSERKDMANVFWRKYSNHTTAIPRSQLALADRKTYPTMLNGVRLRAREFASDRFLVQLDGAPFYQSPGGVPFISLATVVRSGFARTGAVFELDTLLKLPPNDNRGPSGWKKVAWDAAVWLTGLGMGTGLLGVSGYWVRQWWTRTDYQPL